MKLVSSKRTRYVVGSLLAMLPVVTGLVVWGLQRKKA